MLKRKIKKFLIVMLALLANVLAALGQEYRVESFDVIPKDMSARTEGRVDGNGRKCAVIKVYVKDAITDTDGPVIGEIRDRGMEKWVYVSHDAKQIGLLFKEHMPLHIIFADYDFPTLTGQMTYVMKLAESKVKDQIDITSSTNNNHTANNIHNGNGSTTPQPHSQNTTSDVTSDNTNSPKIIEHESVDLGLSVKWATCNLGASSPTDCGRYFAWGETSPKESYTEANCTTLKKDIGDIIDNPSYDAANKIWGENWRIPTKKEFEELKKKCKWKWTNVNGNDGCLITGPNGNSIFIPAAGERLAGSTMYDLGKAGHYWTSQPCGSENAYCLFFNSSSPSISGTCREIGFTIRPVVKE